MRKLVPTIAVLLLSFNLSAQYKKASFFGKEGRTYEFGSRFYMMGEGNGNSIGFKLSLGRDQDGKRLFTSWNLQFIPSHQYHYSSVDEYDNPVMVTGKSMSTLLYGLDWGYHLLKNESEDRPVVQPYLTTGLNILLLGGYAEETYTPEPIGYPKRSTSEQTVSIGLTGGLGCIVNINSKFALKFQGGYAQQFNMGTESWADEVKPFYTFDSHSYVGVGLRLRVVKD